MEILIRIRGPPLLITNVYAPHSGLEETTRIEFFIYLNEYCGANKRGRTHLLIGDFNARLHAVHEHEVEWIGRHVFGKGINHLCSLNHNQTFKKHSLSIC